MKIIIETQPLPKSAHGIAGTDGEAYYVVINSNDTPARQREAFLHEMAHIWDGDLDRTDGDAGRLEKIRHAEALKV